MMLARRDEKGAAVVEFAILMVLVLILLFGIFEFGLLWAQSHYLTNAAREGARVGAQIVRLDQPPTTITNAAEVQSAVETAVFEHLRHFGSPVYQDIARLRTITSVTPSLAFVGAPALPALRVEVDFRTSAVYEPVLWDLLQLISSGGGEAPESLGSTALFPILR